MSARVLLILLTGLALVGVILWLLPGDRRSAGPGELAVQARSTATPAPAPHQQVVLLFVGSDGRLHPELRRVPMPDKVEERALVVVRELLAGPTSGLAPVSPYPAEVHGVFVDGGGNAFVDLTAPPKPLEGSHIELMLAYGVVDSVLLNCPELTAVQILFGGVEVPTLTGHLDLSRPLPLNKRFIAAS